MNWQPDKARWRKLYRGEQHRVTCAELGCPATKEGSYQAANVWWTAKKAEIDARNPLKPKYSHPEAIASLERKRAWAERQGEQEIRAEVAAKIAETKGLGADEEPSDDSAHEMIEAARLLGVIVPEDLDPGAARMLFGDGRLWADRFRREQTGAVPVEASIGGHVAHWLDRMKDRVHAGTLSPGQFDNLRRSTALFVEWIGGARLVTDIDKAALEGFYRHLLKRAGKGEMARESAKARFRHVRQFIAELAQQDIIPLPKNFGSKFVFGTTRTKIPTMAIEEVRTLVTHATGQLKLHLLLMINCGYTQVDIADLRDDEVDWQAGRIVRKRSKTAIHEGVPEADYKLWPSTFSLLKRWRSGRDRVLLTKSGRIWAWESLTEDGSYSGSDSIATNFRNLQDKLGFQKSLKLLRKTSVTLLASNKEYAQFHVYFLGQSDKTVARIHYADYSVPLFHEALAWLGEEYGLSGPADIGETDTARPARSFDDDYADVMPLVLRMRSEGMSQQAIADKLNEMGSKTRRGAAWSQTQIKRILDRAASKV